MSAINWIRGRYSIQNTECNTIYYTRSSAVAEMPRVASCRQEFC